MDALVLSELGVLTKATATFGTSEGLLSIVGVLVSQAVRAVCEVLATLTATLGLLPHVIMLVLDQIGTATKAVTTPGTVVGLLTCV